jgi:hypothetical protein
MDLYTASATGTPESDILSDRLGDIYPRHLKIQFFVVSYTIRPVIRSRTIASLILWVDAYGILFSFSEESKISHRMQSVAGIFFPSCLLSLMK